MGEAVSECPGEGLETNDIECQASGLNVVVCGIANLLRGVLIDQFRGQFSRALGPIQDALAQRDMPSPPGCPTGTMGRSGVCTYPDGTPVPVLLGTDGTGNFGALLSGFSPGLTASASYLLAAGDPRADAEVVGMGMSINMFGGFQSGGHSACVPRVPAPMVPDIPSFPSLRMNVIPGTTTPMDLGIGVSEGYLNHSAYQLWDAGLFCVAAGTGLSQMLSSGTLGALIPTLRQVIFPATNGPVQVVVRPQRPPEVRIGRGTDVRMDPLLNLRLNQVALDFYTWSEERYVRFMTATTDLSIPLNLEVDRMGLRPALGTLRTDNTRVNNSVLISQNPMAIAMALQGLLGPALSMIGNLPPIALPPINVPGGPMGRPLGTINVQIPARGAQGVEEAGARYLGIFANLAYTPAGTMMDSLELDTTVTVEGVQADRRFFHELAFFTSEHLPRVQLRFGTPNDFGHRVEYAWRVDQGGWSMFQAVDRVELQDPAFLRQGAHTVEVRARAQDLPETSDTEPARAEFVIDTEGPALHGRFEADGVVTVDALDNVAHTVEYAFRVGTAPQMPWGATRTVTVPQDVDRVLALARDPLGNVTELTLERQGLIRGGRSTDASGGCGCSVEGQRDPPGGLLALLGALFYALGLRVRRARRGSLGARRAGSPSVLLAPLVLGGAGCNCGETVGNNNGPPVLCEAGQDRCPMTNRCVPAPMCPPCMPGFAVSGMPAFNPATCMHDTAMCGCQRQPPLGPGAVGTYLDMATAQDGTIWLSAYSAGEPSENAKYGDLVVGRWNPELMSVAWTHVDGVPANGMITNDPAGWRGGNSTPGDDVGRFTSIAVTAEGAPRVAYWDTEHDRLKFAVFANNAWSVHTVDESGPGGRYASLVLLAGDLPAVAYRATVLRGDVVQSVVRLARAMTATPGRATDWTLSDVATAPSLCRVGDCPMGQACLEDNGRCAATGAGCMACMPTQGCVGGRCVGVRTAAFVEGIGPGAHYVNLAADPMGRLHVTWYDRDRGNLMLASGGADGRFTAPVILDGEDAMRRDTGDRGIYASLAVGRDATLHLAYVDGWQERLLYLRVQGGRPMGAPEVIDEGAQVGPMTFDDGRHIVGDSASIQVQDDGVVRVAYQDATAGSLRFAVRGAMGWTRTLLDGNDHTGYWAVLQGQNVACWWRNLSDSGDRRWGVRVVPAR
jgi:MYXO-CTERM domain-containing protein